MAAQCLLLLRSHRPAGAEWPADVARWPVSTTTFRVELPAGLRDGLPRVIDVFFQRQPGRLFNGFDTEVSITAADGDAEPIGETCGVDVACDIDGDAGALERAELEALTRVLQGFVSPDCTLADRRAAFESERICRMGFFAINVGVAALSDAANGASLYVVHLVLPTGTTAAVWLIRQGSLIHKVPAPLPMSNVCVQVVTSTGYCSEIRVNSLADGDLPLNKLHDAYVIASEVCILYLGHGVRLPNRHYDTRPPPPGPTEPAPPPGSLWPEG